MPDKSQVLNEKLPLCPLLLIGGFASGKEFRYGQFPCMESTCGFYDTVAKQCSMRSIAKKIGHIAKS